MRTLTIRQPQREILDSSQKGSTTKDSAHWQKRSLKMRQISKLEGDGFNSSAQRIQSFIAKLRTTVVTPKIYGLPNIILLLLP